MYLEDDSGGNGKCCNQAKALKTPGKGLSVATLSDSMVCEVKSWLSHLTSSGSTLETRNLKLETEP
jgi:hypothetical protein